jgi:hypothetical protein
VTSPKRTRWSTKEALEILGWLFDSTGDRRYQVALEAIAECFPETRDPGAKKRWGGYEHAILWSLVEAHRRAFRCSVAMSCALLAEIPLRQRYGSPWLSGRRVSKATLEREYFAAERFLAFRSETRREADETADAWAQELRKSNRA